MATGRVAAARNPANCQPRDNNTLHTEPREARVFLLASLSPRPGERCRYHAHEFTHLTLTTETTNEQIFIRLPGAKGNDHPRRSLRGMRRCARVFEMAKSGSLLPVEPLAGPESQDTPSVLGNAADWRDWDPGVWFTICRADVKNAIVNRYPNACGMSCFGPILIPNPAGTLDVFSFDDSKTFCLLS